jgi:hypothetical protein
MVTGKVSWGIRKAVFRHLFPVFAVLAIAVVSPGLGPLFGTEPVHAAFKAVYIENLAGTYKVEGRNTNGSRYSGQVTITVQGDVANFLWSIAGETYRGTGTLKGTVLTVDWGAKDPVIYQVNPDGSLDGTWAAGRASERLERIR